MKVLTPQISWHGKLAILSLHFQKVENADEDYYKVATGGTEKDIKIWKITKHNDNVQVEFLSNLEYHQWAVNVLRFSPNGVHLASGDSEGIINIWKQNMSNLNLYRKCLLEGSDSVENKETWIVQSRLRDHKADFDVCDLCWSTDSKILVSCSQDCTIIVWDVAKARRLKLLPNDNKRFPMGVCMDPKSKYFVSLFDESLMLVYSAEKYIRLMRLIKAEVPSFRNPRKKKHLDLFHDSSLMTYVRRPAFCSTGDLLIVPAGCIEEDHFCTYVYSRHNFKHFFFTMMRMYVHTYDKVSSQYNGWLPYRCIFAVLTKSSVILYDTEQCGPISIISKIHYHNLTDCSWSDDGSILMISSEEGYCTFVLFEIDELGEQFEDLSKNQSDKLDSNKMPSASTDQQNFDIEKKDDSFSESNDENDRLSNSMNENCSVADKKEIVEDFHSATVDRIVPKMTSMQILNNPDQPNTSHFSLKALNFVQDNEDNVENAIDKFSETV